MDNNPDPMTIQEAMRLAKSPAGQKLLALLKATGGNRVDQARQQAANGDMSQAKQTLSGLLASPEVQKLLKEMKQQNG